MRRCIHLLPSPRGTTNVTTRSPDCDGVIWSGDDLIPGAHSVLDKLRKSGKQIVFVTNNASKSRKAYLKKFETLKIEASLVRFLVSSPA